MYRILLYNSAVIEILVLNKENEKKKAFEEYMYTKHCSEQNLFLF